MDLTYLGKDGVPPRHNPGRVQEPLEGEEDKAERTFGHATLARFLISEYKIDRPFVHSFIS